jgi:maltose-binding protein MalE
MLSEAGHIPAVSGVALASPFLQQAAVAFQGGTAYPVIPEMEVYVQPLDTALRSVFDEGADPVTALQQAHETITSALEKIHGSP